MNSTASDMQMLETLRSAHQQLRKEIGKIIIGQEKVLDELLMAIFCRGHALLVGVPGLAKTLMVSTLAQALDLTFKRIQFTPDLMPTDVTGTDILEEDVSTGRRTWTFVPGPLFTNVLLDYLSAEDEVDVVTRNTTRVDLPEINACTTPEQIVKFQWLVRQVPVSQTVARYAVDLVRATRPHDPNASEMVKKYVQYGASVRATQFITLAAKARALIQRRYHVTHEDVASLALPVMRHRVLTNYFAESDGVDTDKVLADLVKHLGTGDNRHARVG